MQFDIKITTTREVTTVVKFWYREALDRNYPQLKSRHECRSNREGGVGMRGVDPLLPQLPALDLEDPALAHKIEVVVWERHPDFLQKWNWVPPQIGAANRGAFRELRTERLTAVEPRMFCSVHLAVLIRYSCADDGSFAAFAHVFT